MIVEFITKEDLNQFKSELIQEISKLLKKDNVVPKKWLRSAEVRKMLSISPGTLQNLRINGSIQYTKVGGIIYYESDEILRMMDGKGNKI